MDEYLEANQKLWNEWTGEHNMVPLLFSLKAKKTLMNEHNGLKRFSFQFISVCVAFLKYSGDISCKFLALT